MTEVLEILAWPVVGYLTLWYFVWRYRPGGILSYGGYLSHESRKSLDNSARNYLIGLVAAMALALLFISNPREHLLRDGFTSALGMLVAYLHIRNVRPRQR